MVTIAGYDKHPQPYTAGSFGVLNHDQYTNMLSANSNLPTFCGVSTSITNQVIGGFVVSPYEHGRDIGEDILALSAGRSHWIYTDYKRTGATENFNYYGMKAFNLPEERLPPNNIIINKPQSNYVLTLNQVILISFIMILMAVIISALLIIMTIRKSPTWLWQTPMENYIAEKWNWSKSGFADQSGRVDPECQFIDECQSKNFISAGLQPVNRCSPMKSGLIRCWNKFFKRSGHYHYQFNHYQSQWVDI